MKPNISQKANKFLQSPSPIREIMDFADPKYIQSIGLDPLNLVNLAGGFVNHAAPELLLETYRDLIDNHFHSTGVYSPTLGMAECKKAIIKFEEYLFDLRGLEESNIAIGSNSTQLFFSVLMALVDPGDKILFLDPTYCNYPIQALTVCDLEIVRFPMLNAETWHYEAKEKEAAFKQFILENKPKVVILVSPDNPTSQILSNDFVQAAREGVEEIGSFLLLDFAYKTMTFTQEFPEYYSWEPSDNFLSIHSNSKWAKNLGRRMGWVEAPVFVIEVLRSLQNSMNLCPDTLHQMAFTKYVTKAIENGSLVEYIDQTRKLYKKGADFLLEMLEKHLKLPFLKSEGGLYTCVKVDKNGVNFVRDVLNATNVLFVPGWGFGRSLRRGIRVSFGPLVDDLDKIEYAIKKVGKFLYA